MYFIPNHSDDLLQKDKFIICYLSYILIYRKVYKIYTKYIF